jgi:hypothetical protein
VPSVASVEFDIPGLHEGMPETKAISFADDASSFFENLLDIINPLQHIPIVSTIYRAITGDEIAAPARLIGGALFGGPVGFASSVANLIFEEASGDDLAGHALALLSDIDGAPELADAQAPAAEVTPHTSTAATTLATTAGTAEIIWNGPRVLPSLARATAPPSAPQLAVASATVNSGSEINWNGPRKLPSLARATDVIQGSATNDTAHNLPTAVSTQTGNTSPVVTAGRAAAASAPSAGALNPVARPAWLDAAIADAKSVQGAAQNGRAAQKVEGQPWISDAMLEALGKYQTLQLERNR